jgi:hypothetical protein
MNEQREYKTPLVFCNSFPESPVALKVGELQETQNKDARRFKVTVGTPFPMWDKRAQTEITVQGDATVYCKNDDDSLNGLLQAIGAAGCFLGDMVTVTRSGETFSAVPGGEMGAAPVQEAPRQTTAQAIDKDAAARTAAQFSKPPVTMADLARVFDAALTMVEGVFKAHELNDVSTDTMVSVAQTLVHKACDDRTVVPKVVEDNPDDLDF